MRTQEQEANYRHLELIPRSAPQASKPSILQLLQQIWKQLLTTLLLSYEICIYHNQDSNGQPYWCIRDPRTGRSIYCASEQEVRVWIEQYFRGVEEYKRS